MSLLKKSEPPPYEAWLAAIQNEGKGLTAWESEFIESVQDAHDRGLTLSEKQIAIIERIYAEKTPL